MIAAVSRTLARLFAVVLLGLLLTSTGWAQWVALGPDGGDVRRLRYDPRNPSRIYLGTSAGRLFVSEDSGNSWTRFAHLGSGNDNVLDNIEIDPGSGAIYVAAWSVEQQSGDLFRSNDGGHTWQSFREVHGKSIRAMALAPSDPKTIVIGALDGVFRSRDAGETWDRISPANHAEIKNIESVAIDPRNPEVIYVGTWHLPWKTDDGGRSWHSIKRGVIDDSDVFSIIVDRDNSPTVYLSACSGIYKSENAAELFHKVQGIPFSARRTRVLKQDPANPSVVYAGTTEGLWRTSDAGRTWRRVSAANIIVNDVHIDPRNSSRVLLATDRSGVLASNDSAQSFVASNRGFAHRHVATVLADRFDPATLYAGIVNDKEFGGVFQSRDAGRTWRQVNSGIDRLDVFTLTQTENGAVLAGTNHGIFQLARGSTEWQPINVVLREQAVALPKRRTRTKGYTPAPSRVEWVKSELNGRVIQLQPTTRKWYAATSEGLLTSTDEGKSWRYEPIVGYSDFIAVRGSGDVVLAITPRAALISRDGGENWSVAKVPPYVTVLSGGAVATNHVLWLATREGAFNSHDLGKTWEHVLDGLPSREVANITYDSDGHRLLAISAKGALYASADDGRSWQEVDAGYVVRSLAVAGGRLFAATAFDGVIAQPERAQAKNTAASIARSR